MTPAELAALQPHLALQQSANLPNEQLLHQLPLTPNTIASLRDRFNPDSIIYHGNNQSSLGIHFTRPVLRDKTRPLNSWMAFRAWYSHIFVNAQQKYTSTYLTVLWQQDPFKAKWAIVAKAYSTIRDLVGKNNAPLDAFLTIVTPVIGIIGIDDYLEKMNWEVAIGEEEIVSLKQKSQPQLDSFPSNILHTDMTERDIIQLCCTRNYISAADAATLLPAGSAQGQGQAAQQGLLASAPVGLHHHLDHLQEEEEEDTQWLPPFVSTVLTDPTAAASDVLGFDVTALLDTTTTSTGITGAGDSQQANNDQSTEWADTMPDFFDPTAGYIDMENLFKPYYSSWDQWDTAEISNPQALDRMLKASGGVVEGAYLNPSALPLQDRYHNHP